MTHSLSEGENALVGITAGIADITCIQWAYYLKNARQQRLPLTLNPRILYRGYVANCANVAAGTSFQFAIAGALNKLVLRGAQRELTDVEKVGTGFLAGFASGVVASPAELVMTQQQLKGPLHCSLSGGCSSTAHALVFSLSGHKRGAASRTGSHCWCRLFRHSVAPV